MGKWGICIKKLDGFAGNNKMDLEGIVLDCEYHCTGSGWRKIEDSSANWISTRVMFMIKWLAVKF